MTRRHTGTQLQRVRTYALAAWWLVSASMGALAHAQADAPLVAGDLVSVDVHGRTELSASTQVDVNGNISLPYVGNVNVAGLSEEQASARVTEVLKTILRRPRVTVSRGALRAKIEGGRTEDMTTQVITLSNSSAASLYEALQGMTSQGGNIGFDPNTNTLIITDTPGAVKSMLDVIAELDQMETQLTQVRIETKIAEVDDGAMKELGIRWFARGDEVTGGYYPTPSQDANIAALRGSASPLANEEVGGSGSTRTGSAYSTSRRYIEEGNFDRRLVLPVHIPTTGQMFFGLLKPDLDVGALLDALVAEDKAETMATPWIVAVNHRPAHIKMADEWPYSASTTQSFTSTTSTGFLDLGIKLDVTPHVYRDVEGVYVQLELKPEVSFYRGMNMGVPIRAVRSSETITNVRNGQTLVIGGIVLNEDRNVESSVPGLGKMPVIGALFRHRERSKQRRELMVFVTPTVHDTPDSITWDKMLNLSIATESQGLTVPSRETRRESRKD